MPKKTAPKSQAKNKTLFPQYQFFNYFLKVSCKQIHNFNF